MIDETEPEDIPVESSEDAEEEFHPFDEMREDYQPLPIPKVLAADGLPTNARTMDTSDIPPLSVETLVCMEDTSTFVRRDSRTGEVVESYPPEKVKRSQNGSYWVDSVEVEPVRPRCQHYVRQLVLMDSSKGKLHLRLCSARRTTEGTFMTVRDSAVYACSMRSPRHIESEEEILDAFDELKIEQGKHREHHSIFSSGKE